MHNNIVHNIFLNYSDACAFCWLAVWHSGNALRHVNEVTLQRARLVLGWVTVHGTKPSQLGRLSFLSSVGW